MAYLDYTGLGHFKNKIDGTLGKEISDFKQSFVDLMPIVSDGTNRSSNGCAFVWNADKTECTITGTATGTTFSNFFQYSDAFPDGLSAGKTYRVILENFPAGVSARFGIMPNTLPNRLVNYFDSGFLYIPAEATGITGRINVVKGTAFPEGGTTVKIRLVEENINTELNTKKVLVFGNSSTYSIMGYVPSLWQEQSKDSHLKLGILYYSGQSLGGHLTMFNNNTPYSAYSLFETSYWKNLSGITGKNALDSDHWDVIAIQQSNPSLMRGEDKEDISLLCDAITAYLNYPVKFVFLMPMARGANSSSLPSFYPDIDDGEARSDAAFADIASYCEDSLDYAYISDVIPCGAAIQNARHTTLKSIGTEEYLCYDDTGHLQNGIGVLCASYVATTKLMDILHIPSKFFGSIYNPTDSDLEAIYYYTASMHGTCVGVDSANKIIAQKCANMALKYPYIISQII